MSRTGRSHRRGSTLAKGGGLLAVFLLTGATSCDRSSGPGLEPVVLRLAVADSCGAMAGLLAQAYEEERGWVAVQIEIFNSAVAVQRLQDGQADLAVVSWLDGTSVPDGLWSQQFAPYGVAVIVHPSLSLQEVDLDLLRAVFWGQLREVDGQVLEPVSREEGSGTRAFFEYAVLAGGAVAQTSVVMPSSLSVVDYVAGMPGAVGYVSTYVIGDPAEAPVRILPVEGVSPSAATVADGSYPLSSWLTMVTVGEPDGEAREFAQWLLGPGGQDIVWGR